MRFERTTFGVGVQHSIQLSYGHIYIGSGIENMSIYKRAQICYNNDVILAFDIIAKFAGKVNS